MIDKSKSFFGHFFGSLAFKTGVIIILVEIAVLAVIGTFYIRQFSAEIDQQVMARVELPGTLIASGLMSFGSIADSAVMHELVGEDLADGMLVGSQGEVLQSLNPAYLRRNVTEIPGLDPAWFQPEMTESEVIKAPDGLIHLMPIRILTNEQPAFFVYVKTTTARAEAKKAEIVQLFALGSAVTVVLTSIIIIFSFRRLMLRRIKHLLAVLKRVEAGDLTMRSREPFAADELGELQQGINSVIARLENMIATLEQRVIERTVELSEMVERLEELDRLKSRFVADVSHELRTPLASLETRLYLLERAQPDDVKRHVELLRQQLNQLVELATGILDLSRLDLNTRELAFEPLDLSPIVAQVVEAFRLHAETEGLELTCKLATGLPRMMGERNQLSQVAMNLVSNAIKYCPSPGKITIETRASSDEISLIVSDTGMGIDSADLPHVFDRFFRGKHMGQSNIPGTGLGLGIVKDIVELHGGRIDVNSKPGAGSTFTIRFPVASS